jgi:hypothetical protein
MYDEFVQFFGNRYFGFIKQLRLSGCFVHLDHLQMTCHLTIFFPFQFPKWLFINSYFIRLLGLYEEYS